MSDRWRWNIVVAMQPCSFFDEVFFDRKIEAKRRRRDDEVRAFPGRIEAQTGEDVCQSRVGNLDA